MRPKSAQHAFHDRSRASSRRAGTTLVELLAAISVASTVVGLAAGLLMMLLEADAAGRRQVLETQSLAELSQKFRRDVHAAGGQSIGEDADQGGPRLTLSFGDGRRIDYRAERQRLVRVEWRETRMIGRDAFALPPPGTVRFEAAVLPHATFVSLLVDEDADHQSRPAGRVVRVDAALARDHRFESTGASAAPPGEESAP